MSLTNGLKVAATS